MFENARKGEEKKVTFHEEEGITAYVKALNENKEAVHDVAYYKGSRDGIEVECAFQYVDEFQEQILGFAIISIPQRAEPTLQVLRPSLRRLLISTQESLESSKKKTLILREVM